MSPLMNEELISLAAAAKGLPGSRGAARLNPATVWRWTQKGVRAGGQLVRLESIRIGSRTMTSRQAISRFISRCSPQPADAAPSARTPHERKKASEKASQELEQMGA